MWVDIIWSLVVLEKANNEHLASVLSADFVSKLMNTKGKSNYLFFLKFVDVIHNISSTIK